VPQRHYARPKPLVAGLRALLILEGTGSREAKSSRAVICPAKGRCIYPVLPR
jgi:hypothetical protein